MLQGWFVRERDDDGRLVRVHGATMDVTEREDAVQAVARRDDQLRLAFDGSPIGMSMLDARPGHQGRVLRVNRALVEMLGYDEEEELLGATVEAWTPPEDLEAAVDRLDRLFSGELDGAQYEKRYRRRDGGSFLALVTSSVSGRGTSAPVLLTLTERERAARAVAANERRFRGAFDDAPSGMLLLSTGRGSEGMMLRANQALADIVQRPVEELVGICVQDLLVPEDVWASHATFARVHRRAVRPDGTVRDLWCHSIVVDPCGEDGPHVMTHVVDVTAQRCTSGTWSASL